MVHRLLTSGFVRPSLLCSLALVVLGCQAPRPPLAVGDDVAFAETSLSSSERRTRAAQIRDAAAANGITQGWLLAGIADAETGMSQCWSELTWACKGPNSPDCGGGPVVAGAGDGPCSLRQGGLGMFQFDAGTFEDTLRREGDRILTIAGNVAAAVDFTIAMVIRSAHVSGVDTREQAIAWMNGVRIGNSRWDPWIRTVTHYYNGCAPSYSCFSSRYAHYRDNTTGVYEEMGADFWVVGPGSGFAAQYVDQSFPLASEPFVLAPGATSSGYIELRNSGTEVWTPGMTFLGTTEPRDIASPLAGPDWVNPSRPATVDRTVAPGETGRFSFTVRAPDAVGEYSQFFNLVQDGVAWFSSPGDRQLQVRVQVMSGCPAWLGTDWVCAGSERERCNGGMVQREPCPGGCDAGACRAAPGDADGDGHNTSVDCDDNDASVYPGAPDPCGDGVDANCDGVDACDGSDGGSSPDGGFSADGGPSSDGGLLPDGSFGPDGGPVGPTPYIRTATGGCSTTGSGSGPSFLGIWLLAWVRFRRRAA